VLPVLFGAGFAPQLQAQGNGSNASFQVTGYAVSRPAENGWAASVDETRQQVTFTRRRTFRGSVARVTSVTVRAAVVTGERVTADETVQALMTARVRSARENGRATGDYAVTDVVLSDTTVDGMHLVTLKYRRVMQSWRNDGWTEETTLYVHVPSDFADRHQLVEIQVSERYLLASQGEVGPQDAVSVASVVGGLQDRAAQLSAR